MVPPSVVQVISDFVYRQSNEEQDGQREFMGKLQQFRGPLIQTPLGLRLNYEHANRMMAFQLVRAATCNLSQHGHRNLDKESIIIKTARMRRWDCHENRVSGNFQKLFRNPLILQKPVCPFLFVPFNFVWKLLSWEKPLSLSTTCWCWSSLRTARRFTSPYPSCPWELAPKHTASLPSSPTLKRSSHLTTPKCQTDSYLSGQLKTNPANHVGTNSQIKIKGPPERYGQESVKISWNFVVPHRSRSSCTSDKLCDARRQRELSALCHNVLTAKWSQHSMYAVRSIGFGPPILIRGLEFRVPVFVSVFRIVSSCFAAFSWCFLGWFLVAFSGFSWCFSRVLQCLRHVLWFVRYFLIAFLYIARLCLARFLIKIGSDCLQRFPGLRVQRAVGKKTESGQVQAIERIMDQRHGNSGWHPRPLLSALFCASFCPFSPCTLPGSFPSPNPFPSFWCRKGNLQRLGFGQWRKGISFKNGAREKGRPLAAKCTMTFFVAFHQARSAGDAGNGDENESITTS